MATKISQSLGIPEPPLPYLGNSPKKIHFLVLSYLGIVLSTIWQSCFLIGRPGIVMFTITGTLVGTWLERRIFFVMIVDGLEGD